MYYYVAYVQTCVSKDTEGGSLSVLSPGALGEEKYGGLERDQDIGIPEKKNPERGTRLVNLGYCQDYSSLALHQLPL